MNQHDDSISESNVGGQNSLLSNPSENSSLMKNMQSLENLDKEKLAKEVSEILTNLPEIANASKSKPNVNLKNDEQQKEDLSENENSSNDDSLPTTSENVCISIFCMYTSSIKINGFRKCSIDQIQS